MILLPKETIVFPNPYYQKEDIVAIGGDLSPKRVLLAYQNGIFPWFNEGEEILWWSPLERFVLFPRQIKISKSMRKIMKSNCFEFKENHNFEAVIKNCAHIKRSEQDGTWITEQMIETYLRLHQLGIAKSIEVYQNNILVGGFYGIMTHNIFCGESMFSKVSNASKAGLIYFAEKYCNQVRLIDCQVYSQHLESLGATLIRKDIFLDILDPQIKNKKLCELNSYTQQS
ncbi:leucyl/phenylalanyl-tRNA--protein transferase [Riemerella anatipestifer]|uniref:leucyl/phenylalanyl-tRNA--protein transferase n=1 Tax=Riemerella anatipestifer TaxID=34085 RepID=UPI0012AE3A55|nr:leucyl/phenylalanyl-tRNA--protein transferase [Riemerella anatipestifer]USL96460.1 leucyl/phenylalanyl-tRNA--protein transferase [Riemerella anatipestifer]